MTVATTSGKNQWEKDRLRLQGRAARPAAASAVPPSYPDPESWRRFGLLRRQLQHTKGLNAVTSEPVRE